MMMNEVVDGWKRQHVGSNQIGSEERDPGLDPFFRAEQPERLPKL